VIHGTSLCPVQGGKVPDPVLAKCVPLVGYCRSTVLDAPVGVSLSVRVGTRCGQLSWSVFSGGIIAYGLEPLGWIDLTRWS
jgi:hypothetical protein